MNIIILEIANAIRENGVPQMRGQYKLFKKDTKTWTDEDIISACAVGMASHNLHIPTGSVEDRLDYTFKGGTEGRVVNKVRCPANDITYTHDFVWAYPATLSSIVIHLNDDHKWTFAQIADFLEDYANAYDG